MTWRGYLLVLAILALIASAGWAIDRALTPPLPFPPSVLDIVESPEKVRVQRMLPLQDGSPPLGAAFYENCSLVGTGKAVDPPEDWLRDFTGIVLDGRTYDGPTATGTPAPKVVVRFVRGEKKIDVMVAFDHNTVVVQEDGRPCGTGVFTSRREELVYLVQKAFPDDPELRNLSVR